MTALRYIIGIDPSINRTGVAVFDTRDGKWLGAFVTQPSGEAEIGLRLQAICQQIIEGLEQILPGAAWADAMVALEWPVHYPNDPKSNPNDLMLLSGAAGVIAGLPFAEVHTFTPITWKGQIPKDVHHKQLRLKVDTTVLDNLDSAHGSYAHNGYDAVGLAQFYRERRFPLR